MNANHVEEGLALLLTQFSGSEKLKNLLGALLGQLQETDDSFYALSNGGFIDNAQGDALDLQGKIVGQERGSMLDDEFNLWIKTRILLNHCQGTSEDIYGLLRVILDEGVPLKIVEHPETSFTLEIPQVIPQNIHRIFDLVCAAKAVGTRALLHHAVKNPVFKFDISTQEKSYLSALIC